MSPSRLLIRGAVVVVALTLGACGGSLHPNRTAGRGQLDDPRANKPNRIKCLQQHGLSVTPVGTTGLRIGSPPAGPVVQFEPTAGAAQADQIQNREQGAEVVGSALLYPNQGSDQELQTIEDCLATGVKG